MLVERTGVARLPTKWGTFTAYSYTSKLDGIEHIAMVKVSMFCNMNMGYRDFHVLMFMSFKVFFIFIKFANAGRCWRWA